MSEMNRESPLVQHLWILALPPAVLCASTASMVWSGWGKGDSQFVGFALVGGALGALAALVASLAVYPIAIYELAKHPELRTSPRLAVVFVGSSLTAFAFLVLLGGGI